MATTSTDVTSQTIIDTILADVNAIVPNFSALVNSYRLLVGSAEEIHRIPGVTNDVYARAIERFDRSGVLIDILIDLLCCKITFSSEFLALTCAPVDLFRLLANPQDTADTPHEVAEEIVLLEVVRRARECLRNGYGLPPCTPPHWPPYTFGTSCVPPVPPPPPPIPPETPGLPPCFEPRPEALPKKTKPEPEGDAASADEAEAKPPDKETSGTSPAAGKKKETKKTVDKTCDDNKKAPAAPNCECGPVRPRRLKK